MANNKDFKVKSGIEATNIVEGLGTITAGSEGYSLADASFDGVTASFSGQAGGDPRGFRFSTDGTKFYVAEANTPRAIHQYNLTTAWDASTASYSTKSFDYSSEETQLTGIAFKSDGTKMYITGYTGDDINEYNLNPAWDVSTASYSQNYSFQSSETSSPQDLYFKPDGTSFYISAYNSNASAKTVFQYNLSSAWDVSTASYSNNYVNVLEFQGLAFNANGTSFYVVGHTNDTVYEYNLTTAWDVSTASASGQTFNVSSQDTFPNGIDFKSDGTKMFIAGLGGKDVNQYSTVLNLSNLDLSTGSVFNFTPTSNTKVTLINPAPSGTVSQATLVYNGEDPINIGSVFSTTLYTGNSGTAQTITNGLDLSGQGGLVWIKARTQTNYHYFFDTKETSNTHALLLPLTSAKSATTTALTSFNNNGFSLGSNTNVNGTHNMVAWSWKQAPKFFDIQTWTGNATAGRTVSHDLGSVPGMIIVKRTDGSGNWAVYHRKVDGGTAPETYSLFLDATNAQTDRIYWNDTAPTSTTITLGADGTVNGNNQTYVAYIFAHNDGDGPGGNDIIKCGNYTGNGSTTGPEVNLGFEPQFIMIKRYNATANWTIVDTVRGITQDGDDPYLQPNRSDLEFDGAYIRTLTTGFQPRATSAQFNASGSTYVYMAIASASAVTTTYNNTIDWPGGTAPTSPAIGETDVLTFSTSDGGATYKAVHAIDGAK